MDVLSYKTVSVNKKYADKKWVLINAEDIPLGRLSSEVAKILRGKYKTNFTPHADCGDYVIVINADNVKLTGKKLTDRKYFSYSGYPGGQKIKTPEQIKQKSASLLVEKAVKGMLPKNRLGRKLFKNLFVYNDADHPHEAQTPNEMKLKNNKA